MNDRAGFLHVWDSPNRPPVVSEAGLGGVQRLALYTAGGGSFIWWDLSEDLREGAGRLIMVSYCAG